MNYKLLFPTYRTRFRFVEDRLHAHKPEGKFVRGLNLGSGEGDYDPMIVEACQDLVSCDINADDLAFAQGANAHISNLTYEVQGALDLDFPDNHFDLIVSVDVLEHVEDPARMMAEVGRVLAPGGLAVITFPQTRFPITYDPINGALGRRAISLGAYAFGHDVLVDPDVFVDWTVAAGLEVLSSSNLSGYLVGLAEMYWPGILQGLFKANAKNLSEQGEGAGKLRPTSKPPAWVGVTDGLIALDRGLFRNSSRSIGKGFILRKL